MADNENTIFIVTHEIPEDHGSHDFSFSEDKAKEMYNKYIENAEPGQITRLLTLDIRQLVSDALDDILWMRRVPMEDMGVETLAEHNMPEEPMAPEQVEKLAHEWALSHGVHSYDDINNDIMEQFEISFAEADQITNWLDSHAHTARISFGPVN